MIELPEIPTTLKFPLMYVAIIFPEDGIIFSKGKSYANAGGIHSFKEIGMHPIYFNGSEGTTEEIEKALTDLGWRVVIDDD